MAAVDAKNSSRNSLTDLGKLILWMLDRKLYHTMLNRRNCAGKGPAAQRQALPPISALSPNRLTVPNFRHVVSKERLSVSALRGMLQRFNMKMS